MHFTHKLFAVAASLIVASTATAQLSRLNYVTRTAGSAFDRGIGNSWLGGSVHSHLYLTTTNGTLTYYSRAALDAQARATANLLQMTGNVAEVSATLSSTATTTSTTRSGAFRVRVLGYDLVNRSFTSSTTAPNQTWAFNAFPVAPRIDVGVGPFTLTLTGNFGASLNVSANYQLPLGTPAVSAYGAFNAAGTAQASVAVGIPYVLSFGVRLQGRVLDTSLVLFGGANALSGFFGTGTVSLIPITLRLVGFVDVPFYTYTNTLCSWSAAAYSANLF